MIYMVTRLIFNSKSRVNSRRCMPFAEHVIARVRLGCQRRQVRVRERGPWAAVSAGCCGRYRFSYLVVARYGSVGELGCGAGVLAAGQEVRARRVRAGSVICGGRSWARGGRWLRRWARARRRAAGGSLPPDPTIDRCARRPPPCT